MTEDQYLSFCKKYLDGECSPAEAQLLLEYQEKNGFGADYAEADAMRVHKILQTRIQQSIKTNKKPVRLRLLSWQVAASFVIILTAVLYFRTDLSITNTKRQRLLTKKAAKKAEEIRPGSTNAVLTLSNGQSIKLNGSKDGMISNHGNAEISKSGNGLVITANGDEVNIERTLNQITVPRGGKYDITLPDGTRVWLNSSSALSFPIAFKGKERKVFLTGEAYFEVAKNKDMPFKIEVAGKQEVEVIGTHFNITAFAEDHIIKTTLLEGAVKIKYKDSKVLIKPGEMAINNLKTPLKVVPADLEQVMAWKNDMFLFDNENIISIMNKISRWYNVDVTYRGDMSDINFDGNYSRSKGLNVLLKNIALTDRVRFVIEERRVTVIAK